MTPIFKKLIHEFQFLPGIGEKTAQRFAHYIFSRHQQSAKNFAQTLLDALEQITHCSQCRNLCENDICEFCLSEKRDQTRLCVVEHPSTVTMIESTGVYQGCYFILHGALSPIDGVGPNDLGIGDLHALIAKRPIKELILATSSKIEGEATAYYLYDQFKDKALVTRLAYGIPIGGSLDYLDGQTLSRALHGRQAVTDDE